VPADEHDVADHRLPYLTSNDWALIGAKAHRRVFKLGEEIIRQGSLGDRIFILRSGEASVEIAVTSKRTVLARLVPGDVCGEIAFLERGKTTAAVVARDTEVEVDEITYGDLRETFEAFPRLATRFYHSLALVLARRLEQTSRQLAGEMAATDRQS
jgi:CRP-like cAMP-binding protein